MDLPLSTPSLLFPAVSLLLLAYTNRFLSLANLVRALYADYQKNHEAQVLAQIQNLRLRISLIQSMQTSGVLSLLFCTLSMLLIYLGVNQLAAGIFGFSLLLMIVSLFLSVWEIHISTRALRILLSDLEDSHREKRGTAL
jgi:Zn-dependent membrane protease YugP